MESITYRNEDSGFTVLEVSSGGELITAVGIMPLVCEGEDIELYGDWDNHKSYGPQFKAEACEHRLPSSKSAVQRYLASGAIKGIGPATAVRIVDKFGDDTFNILQNEPELLVGIKGISKSRALEIAEDFRRRFGLREVIAALAKYGINAEEAIGIYKIFGADAADIVESDPFILCSAGLDFAFERVDLIADYLGLPKDMDSRISAAVIYILRHNLLNGHTCLPQDKLLETAYMLLGEISAEKVCGRLIENGSLREMEIEGRSFVFLENMFSYEQEISRRIKLMLLSNPLKPVSAAEAERRISNVEAALSIKYEDLQRKAISEALRKGMLVLTGGPGTGKTTTLNAIISIFEDLGIKTLLAAPTGRAAKRMTEITDRESKTIHRLLEVEFQQGDMPVFRRNYRNPLECDAIVIDEMSMIDAQLFCSLLDALPLGCRIIMVGDADQLPSVGAGNVLHDIIDAKIVPVIRLNRVFRQAMQSLIVTNAHAIINGQKMTLDCKDGDFFFMRQHNPAAAARLIAELYTERLPAAYGFDPKTDIQVLCPSRKRQLGTINLNNILQDIINSGGRQSQIKRGQYTLRVGDKVMQSRNDYDIEWSKGDGTPGHGVFNGDIGILEEIDRRSGNILVRFDDRLAIYSEDSAENLELAYAVTVHKSQGSEFDCVIMPVIDIPYQLCYRNLLYTAVTRAKSMIILVGTETAAEKMVQNDRRIKRYTALKYMLLKEDANEAFGDNR